MQKLNFNNPAGWPASVETFEWLQNMVLQLQSITHLGGSLFIVSGCEEVAGVIQNGTVVINGEILPFQASALSVGAKVVITEQVENRIFFDSLSKPYYHNRFASFGVTGDPVTEYAWADFKRSSPSNGLLSRVDKIEKMLKPLIGYDDPANPGTTVYGSWLFWGRPADEIPAGWEAVPDAEWKGRVPVVMDESQTEFNEVGKTGGAKAHTLTPNEQGSIKWRVRADDGDMQIAARKTIQALQIGEDFVDVGGFGNDQYSDWQESSLEADADEHNNLQPYKVVMFIRWVG